MKKGIFKFKVLVISLIIAFCSVCFAPLFSVVAENTEVVNNFNSRSSVYYSDINGKTVGVDMFYRDSGEALNNPNVAQAIMIKQATDYKIKYPEKDVTVTCTSFHVSVVASVCLDRESKEFGRMKSLYDCEYDDNGYYRISYLLVEAAKYGVNVIVIGQIDASGVLQEEGTKPDYDFIQYFESHLNDPCYDGVSAVKDFMVAKKAYWTSYGDKEAYDMMHLKTCTVTNYIDANGNECGPAVWTGCINLDGINMYGSNGNDGIQTAIVITEHEEIRRVTYNFTKLLAEYCEQEHVNYFRNIVKETNKKQISLILEGKESEIAKDEQIVYMGSENDKVFEVYFTPTGGATENWNVKLNPLCKYISKLLPSVSGEDYVELFWNNVKFVSNFPLAKTLEDVIQYSFTENSRLNNRLYLHLEGIDTLKFEGLKVGENIGFCSVNKYVSKRWPHSKDLQLSYKEKGVRYYVNIINSLNFHSGSMFGQTNSYFVIKESQETGNKFYCDYGKLTVPDADFESIRI